MSAVDTFEKTVMFVSTVIMSKLEKAFRSIINFQRPEIVLWKGTYAFSDRCFKDANIRRFYHYRTGAIIMLPRWKRYLYHFLYYQIDVLGYSWIWLLFDLCVTMVECMILGLGNSFLLISIRTIPWICSSFVDYIYFLFHTVLPSDFLMFLILLMFGLVTFTDLYFTVHLDFPRRSCGISIKCSRFCQR